MGDISDIHPQLINELYNDGILTTKDPVGTGILADIDPNNFSEQLGEYYDTLINELNQEGQIESLLRQAIIEQKKEEAAKKKPMPSKNKPMPRPKNLVRKGAVLSSSGPPPSRPK